MMSQTAGMGLWSWSGLELALGERGANAEGQHGKATGATAGLRFQDELKRKTARTFIAQQLLQIFVSLKIVYRTNCDMVISETLGFARSLRQNGAPWLCRCRRGPWSASSWLCRKMKSIICVARSTRGFLWATISGLNWAVGSLDVTSLTRVYVVSEDAWGDLQYVLIWANESKRSDHQCGMHSTTILHYTTLYYTMLYITIHYYTILYYTILYYTILYYTILYYTTLHTTMHLHVQYDTLFWYSMI